MAMSSHHAGIGVLVLGYNRPSFLELVLKSLQQQNALPLTHVWLDGASGRASLISGVSECREVASRFPIAELRAHSGHLGIERLMLDGLSSMMQLYDRILVIEDDCIPVLNAVELFSDVLDQTRSRSDVFSTYGHWFMVPAEGATITRFQGWGWAIHTDQLRPIMKDLTDLYALSEKNYLAEIKRRMTPSIRARLDVTPGRNVISVMESFFSWDSCMSFLTAERNLLHAKTAQRAIYNCGMGVGGGHFGRQDIFRAPPFNMVLPEEIGDIIGITDKV